MNQTKELIQQLQGMVYDKDGYTSEETSKIKATLQQAKESIAEYRLLDQELDLIEDHLFKANIEAIGAPQTNSRVL